MRHLHASEDQASASFKRVHIIANTDAVHAGIMADSSLEATRNSQKALQVGGGLVSHEDVGVV
jgi:hypothetical protein